MPQYNYYQINGGEEAWQPVPVALLPTLIADKKPKFTTVLAVSALAEDLSREDRDALKYAGPLYFDWDGKSNEAVTEAAIKLLQGLADKGLDMSAIKIFATGGRGYHCEIPPECFMDKVPKAGIQYLPLIYKEMAFTLAVDLLDLLVYSGGRGRMWRTPNVQRENEHYKVQITWDELLAMTPELYLSMTATPRPLFNPNKAAQCLDLTILFDKAAQSVKDKIGKRRKKGSTDNSILRKSNPPSIVALMEGRGIKAGVGFHQLSLQLGIVSDAMGWSEEDLLEKAKDLIESHAGDGNRYNTPDKRATELVRMHRYTHENPCYEFSIGALKVLLDHDAPDLDGIPVTKEEVDAGIEQAKNEPVATAEVGSSDADAYNDVAGGLTMTKYGVYATQEDGSKKRICAISFDDPEILRDAQTGSVSCYTAVVLINGKPVGRQTMELEMFSGLQAFNRFAARHAHVLQGSDSHVRGLLLRLAQKATMANKVRYVAKREGLDVVSIPGHENELLHRPFLVWSDNKGVQLEPRIAATGVQMSFQGYPDPRGNYRTDLADAPELREWAATEQKEVFRAALHAFIGCQRPDVIGNFFGWYTACFYRMMFNKVYDKFPLLHVAGNAGAGKSWRKNTEMLRADGSVVLVQDIKVGDQLLGPDSGVRNVLALGRGREMMYKITPVKGDPYFVNESHILTLRKSDLPACRLADGTLLSQDADLVNVSLKTYIGSLPSTRKMLKGWRASAVEFHRKTEQTLDPYWLGLWLGDGKATDPTIYKPLCRAVQWWVNHAADYGHEVSEYAYQGKCSGWNITKVGGKNLFTLGLRQYNLINNKHIPEAYKFGSIEQRLQLIAGLLDSDGSVSRAGYDWVSKDEQMAKDFAFVCRSVGLAAYITQCQKGIKSTGFVGIYWRVSVSGDCERIPCLDKIAPPRKQIKRHLVHGITVEPVGVEDYYGVVLDGDHLLLLSDFTVNHNTEMNRTMLSLFYYNQDGKELTPQSSIFAIQQNLSSSSSIPLLVDEYKPTDMGPEMHNKLKLLWRDAYNNREIAKGGGTRENEDYRSLSLLQISAPIVFVAESMEEEPATMERVVMVTVVRPPDSIAAKWSMNYSQFNAQKQNLSVMGKHIAAEILNTYSLADLRAEFDVMYRDAQFKYMINAQDIESGATSEVLRAKQGAKQRTVFNFTVSAFGLRKFRKVVELVYGPNEFKESFERLEGAIYDRMADLLPATQAEYLKVLSMMAAQSYLHVDEPSALIKGIHYDFIDMGGKACLEMSLKACYHRYRTHCRTVSYKPLFNGDGTLQHAMRDSAALVTQGGGVTKLNTPGGSFVFDMNELKRLGVEDFKT